MEIDLSMVHHIVSCACKMQLRCINCECASMCVVSKGESPILGLYLLHVMGDTFGFQVIVHCFLNVNTAMEGKY